MGVLHILLAGIIKHYLRTVDKGRMSERETEKKNY